MSDSTSNSPAVGFPRAAWKHWTKIGHAVGVVQTRVLMVIFFFIFVLPVGVVMRLRGDPLHLKARHTGNWSPHHQDTPSLESVRRQF